MKKNAFTLAEVLITLGIIGVVAALVMPSLMQNYEKKKTVTQLKEVYSVLSQAAKRAEVEHGTIDEWDMNLTSKQFAQTYFEPYLKVARRCNSITEGCWKDNGWWDLNNNKITQAQYSIVLPNGVVVGFAKPITAMHVLVVDINGRQGPGRLGRDVFAFLAFSAPNSYNGNIKDRGVASGLLPGSYANGGLPHWAYPETELTGKTSAWGYTCGHCFSGASGTCEIGVGAGCTAAIAKYDWKITDDYPWKN